MKWPSLFRPKPLVEAAKPAEAGDAAFNRRVASFRAAHGIPEKFVVSCACARHERGFVVTFERCDKSEPFRVARIDKDEGGGRRSLVPPKPQTIPAGDIDWAEFTCPWCAHTECVWCVSCKIFVCGGRTVWDANPLFHCRPSCRMPPSHVSPLKEISGSDGSAKAPAKSGGFLAAGPALPRPGDGQPKLPAPPMRGKLK